MQLLIFRHGIAEDHATDGSDSARALTAEGIKKTQAAAEGLATLIDKPGVILTSPKVRAKQTAAIVGRVFKVEPTDEPLLADGTIDEIIAALARRREASVVIVGHEPTFSRMIFRLLTGRPAPAGHEVIELKKAGCACLTVAFDDDAAFTSTLHWLVTPKVLRDLV